MSAPSDPRTLVLHGLRLKGFADLASAAEVVGLAEQDAQPHLDSLLAERLVTYREGRLSGYLLTPAGRARHALLLAEELDRSGVREGVHDAYKRFLDLNTDLLTVCTAWQLREVDGHPTTNDHSDAAHDAEVVERLARLHHQVLPICADLTGALSRYALYGPRLTHAYERVEAGDVDWFTKPMIASYHTVWFELHEDLLATLGIERGSETSS